MRDNTSAAWAVGLLICIRAFCELSNSCVVICCPRPFQSERKPVAFAFAPKGGEFSDFHAAAVVPEGRLVPLTASAKIERFVLSSEGRRHRCRNALLR